MAEATKEAGKKPIDRVIRVFVSSTFADMHAEREELVKRVFPELRKLCEARGVTWGEVDLRWGIPDERKAEGKVLPICLGNQALILKARGQLDQAMALHKEQERICRQLGNLDSLQISLCNQAGILYARGQLDQAMASYK